MIKKSKFYQVSICLLAIVLISGTFLPYLTLEAQAMSYFDPFLDEYLPEVGENNNTSPFLPENSVGQGLAGVPQNYPTWDDQIPSQDTSTNNLSDNPVSLPAGGVTIGSQDVNIPSYGYPINLNRQYQSENKDKLSPFGYGWDFSYSNYIQLFADFNVAEFKPYGSQANFDYTKNNPLGLVDSYDNDPLIYYPLDQGYYTSESQSELERIGVTTSKRSR